MVYLTFTTGQKCGKQTEYVICTQSRTGSDKMAVIGGDFRRLPAF